MSKISDTRLKFLALILTMATSFSALADGVGDGAGGGYEDSEAKIIAVVITDQKVLSAINGGSCITHIKSIEAIDESLSRYRITSFGKMWEPVDGKILAEIVTCVVDVNVAIDTTGDNEGPGGAATKTPSRIKYTIAVVARECHKSKK